MSICQVSVNVSIFIQLNIYKKRLILKFKKKTYYCMLVGLENKDEIKKIKLMIYVSLNEGRQSWQRGKNKLKRNKTNSVTIGKFKKKQFRDRKG